MIFYLLLSLTTLISRIVFIWIQVFLKTLLIPVVLLFLDAVPDIVLVDSYRQNWWNPTSRYRLPSDYQDFDSCQDSNRSTSMPFVCFPKKLGHDAKFFYALAFVISPWFFYLFEYFHSDHCVNFQKVSLVFYLQLLLTTPISRNSKL